MPRLTPSISASNLSLSLPGGVSVFARIDLALGPGRHGLTGPNGGGKTSLLRLIAGQLKPTVGSVAVQGEIGYLPQRLVLEPAAPVSRLLGIEDKLTAINALEAGSANPALYDVIGDDWDIAEKTTARLAALGLDHLALNRPVGSLSGGEAILVSWAALMRQRPGILLADEPTNNLDRTARRRLMDGIGQFKGVALVVTHDLDLLDRMDRIGELRDGQLRWYEAPFAAFEAAKAVEVEAKERALTQAQAELKREQRDLAQARTNQARRDRVGRKAAGSLPKIVAHARAGAAQVSAGKSKKLHERRLEASRDRLEAARAELGRGGKLKLELPGAAVPPGRDVLELDHVRPEHTRLDVSLHLRGPERIALTGPNGIGKTSLLACVMGAAHPESGTVRLLVPARLLPQGLDLLRDELSPLENIVGPAPDQAEDNRVRAGLARLGLAAAKAERPVGSLSGGERWRATLAALLLARPLPQLILADEQTNNLDLDGVELLTEALVGYPGAFIVVSHDRQFLDSIKPDRTLDLG
ncbi:MAG: ATP-binding cassette domain-containing protein [Bifidobacteriaceae bacterium]|jgi:ATPase subunit of ABC transporter with duplicated ATPase domains|nr:ATP-binding cassette domain-containing protein [Bifidobacteriaceae bacterium]